MFLGQSIIDIRCKPVGSMRNSFCKKWFGPMRWFFSRARGQLDWLLSGDIGRWKSFEIQRSYRLQSHLQFLVQPACHKSHLRAQMPVEPSLTYHGSLDACAEFVEWGRRIGWKSETNAPSCRYFSICGYPNRNRSLRNFIANDAT